MFKIFVQIIVVLLLFAMPAKAYASSKHKSRRETNVNGILMSKLKSYMNERKNPCEDFYNYACGNWEKVHDDETKFVDAIGRLAYKANKQIAEILEQRIAVHKREHNDVYRKLRAYYEVCREHALNADVSNYMELLKRDENIVLPQFEITQWQSAEWNWLALLGKLRSYGLNNVLLKSGVYMKNAVETVLELDKPAQLAFELEERESFEYYKYSKAIKARIRVEQLQFFEEKLLRLANAHNATTMVQHEFKLSELEKRLPGMQIRTYFSALLQQPAQDDLLILVHNLPYLRKLNDFMNSNIKETAALYMRVKLEYYLATQMPRSSAAHDCVHTLRTHLTLALNYLYEREQYQYERNATDAVVMRIFNDLQQKFYEILAQHEQRLSSEQLSYLRDKLAHIHVNIGNLPKNVDERYYINYYRNFHIQHNSFERTHLNAMQHHTRAQLHILTLNKPAPEHTYDMTSYPSPAFENTKNLLIIPFAYLQMPAFHKDLHELFLFAELGNTLAHEIMHGFDTDGVLLDAYGNPSHLFVDTLHQQEHFNRSLACLQREFTFSLDEKIADFSGFRLAFETYFARPIVSKFRGESTLSNKQLYFIKFAQFFCAIDPSRIKYEHSHDLPFQRVPQVVMNFADFAQEFDCATHAHKIPKEKCHLW